MTALIECLTVLLEHIFTLSYMEFASMPSAYVTGNKYNFEI